VLKGHWLDWKKKKRTRSWELHALEASKARMSERISEANLKVKRSNEKVEELKTQVKGHK
jgi:hypothetical protein